jgi:hypothetical protein
VTRRPWAPLDRPDPLAAALDRHSTAFPGARLPCLRGIGGAGGVGGNSERDTTKPPATRFQRGHAREDAR